MNFPSVIKITSDGDAGDSEGQFYVTEITVLHDESHTMVATRDGILAAQKEAAMFSLPHLLYGLAAFYGVLGVFFLRMGSKPNCRTCANRDDCPNRARGVPKFARRPRCLASKKT